MANEPWQSWSVDWYYVVGHPDPKPKQSYELAMSLKPYLLQGGDCPLLDLARYPMTFP